jgi:hypothetical protein
MPQRFRLVPSNMPKKQGSAYGGTTLVKDNRIKVLPMADNLDRLSYQRKYPLYGLLRQANQTGNSVKLFF